MIIETYCGAGSPSASHSIINGLSLSLGFDFTWKRSSSVGGSLIIFGGLCTEIEKKVFCYKIRFGGDYAVA